MGIINLFESMVENLKDKPFKLLLITAISILIPAFVGGCLLKLAFTSHISYVYTSTVLFLIGILIYFLMMVFRLAQDSTYVAYFRGEKNDLSTFFNYVDWTIPKSVKIGIKIMKTLILFVIGYILANVILGNLLIGITAIMPPAMQGINFFVLNIINFGLIALCVKKLLEYAFVFYLVYDYPEEEIEVLMQKSREMMYGNKAKLLLIDTIGVLICLFIAYITRFNLLIVMLVVVLLLSLCNGFKVSLYEASDPKECFEINYVDASNYTSLIYFGIWAVVALVGYFCFRAIL